MPMKSKPLKTFRAGSCSAAVFLNEQETEKGTVRLPTIAFSCRYRDEATGEWRDAASMRPNEVARAVVVLQRALEYCWIDKTEKQEPSS